VLPSTLARDISHFTDWAPLSHLESELVTVCDGRLDAPLPVGSALLRRVEEMRRRDINVEVEAETTNFHR